MSQGPPIPPCYISHVNDNSQPEELEQCAALQMHGNTAVAHNAPANVSDTNLPTCTVRLWEFSRWVRKLQPLLAPRASVPTPCSRLLLRLSAGTLHSSRCQEVGHSCQSHQLYLQPSSKLGWVGEWGRGGMVKMSGATISGEGLKSCRPPRILPF